MGVHRNNNMKNIIHFFLSTNKKFIHMKKPSQRTGGYRNCFSPSVHPYGKKHLTNTTHSRWLLNYSSTYISNEWRILPINLLLLGKKPTQNHQPFFTFYCFASDIQIHIGLSQQQQYPESTIFENTKRASHGQSTITHDDYQLSPYNKNDLRA